MSSRQNARANGVRVHWAKDAADHNQIVHGILQSHGAKTLIKSKSMLTEEVPSAPTWRRGCRGHRDRLGERIQELHNEAPSHIVVPAVHKTARRVAQVFAEHLGTDPDGETSTTSPKASERRPGR